MHLHGKYWIKEYCLNCINVSVSLIKCYKFRCIQNKGISVSLNWLLFNISAGFLNLSTPLISVNNWILGFVGFFGDWRKEWFFFFPLRHWFQCVWWACMSVCLCDYLNMLHNMKLGIFAKGKHVAIHHGVGNGGSHRVLLLPGIKLPNVESYWVKVMRSFIWYDNCITTALCKGYIDIHAYTQTSEDFTLSKILCM